MGPGANADQRSAAIVEEGKWPIYADIELEYKVPPDSDAVKEVAKCVEYCKAALA
jgi:hypothetical protein